MKTIQNATLVLLLVTATTTFILPTHGSWAQAIQDRPETATPDQASDAATAEQVEKILDIFVSDLDALIPGDVTKGGELELALRKAAQAFRDKKFADARKIIQDQKTANPKLPPTDLVFAGLYFSANRADVGFQLLEAAAKSDPEHPGIYLAFGRMALNQSRFTDCRALLEKAVRKIQAGKFDDQEKTHFKSQYYEAITLVSLRQSRYKEATKMAAAFEALDPKDPKSLTVNAEVAFRNKDTAKSLDYLNQLKAIIDTTRTPELIIATWFGQTNDLKNAEKWVTTAAEKYPDDMKVQTEYANWLVGTEKFDDAKPLIAKIEATKKESISTISLKAKIAFADRDYGAAENEYAKLFDANSDSFDVANMYAMSLIESPFEEKKKIALQLAERNYKSLSSNQVAQAALGWVYYRRGDTKNARELFARAARSPQMPAEVAYFLARFLTDLEDYAKADQLLTTALKQEGLYLYRLSAKELLKNVKAKQEAAQPNATEPSDGALPNPGK